MVCNKFFYPKKRNISLLVLWSCWMSTLTIDIFVSVPSTSKICSSSRASTSAWWLSARPTATWPEMFGGIIVERDLITILLRYFMKRLQWDQVYQLRHVHCLSHLGHRDLHHHGLQASKNLRSKKVPIFNCRNSERYYEQCPDCEPYDPEVFLLY